MKNWSKWVGWKDRENLDGISYSGVYAIAIAEQVIAGKDFDFEKEIAYFGMTNSKGGLKNRLQQFDNTIQGKEGHGGAKRFRKKYPDYHKLIEVLYVAVKPFKCDTALKNQKDLLVMGKVAEFEYICFAEYLGKYGSLPEFNDMKRSPKD